MFNDVLSGLTHKPVTVQYPVERRPVPAQFRGALAFNPTKCTGCALCVKDCPADAIRMVVNDKSGKRFVIQYDVDRCAFCGQCVYSCRFDCLTLAAEQWELATLNKDHFRELLGDKANVDEFVARGA